MFFENTYQAGTSKNYKYHEITHDDFSLLAMGFTGKKALQWKLNYINAFNLVETNSKEKSTLYIENYIKKLNITNNYIEEKPRRSASKNNRKSNTKLIDENQKNFLRSQLEGYIYPT